MEIIYTLGKWLAIAFLLTTAGALAGWYSARAYCERYLGQLEYDFKSIEDTSEGRHHLE